MQAETHHARHQIHDRYWPLKPDQHSTPTISALLFPHPPLAQYAAWNREDDYLKEGNCRGCVRLQRADWICSVQRRTFVLPTDHFRFVSLLPSWIADILLTEVVWSTHYNEKSTKNPDKVYRYSFKDTFSAGTTAVEFLIGCRRVAALVSLSLPLNFQSSQISRKEKTFSKFGSI